MGGIYSRQLKEKNLLKLASIHVLKWKANKIVSLQIVMVSLPVIIGTISVLTRTTTPRVTILCSLLGFFVTLTNFIIIYPKLSGINLKASQIRQDFDTDVLKLPWNYIKLEKPDFEEIVLLSRNYLKSNPEFLSIDPWYAKSVDKVPLPVARLICQRKFLGGDGKVRNRFILSVKILVVVLFILSILISSINSLSLGQFLSNLFFPFLPSSVFIIKLIQDNNNSIKHSNFLKTKIESIWSDILKSDYPEKNLLTLEMQIQDELLEKRRNDPLIFDYLYDRFSSKIGSSKYESDTMVEEYMNKIMNH